MIHKFKILQRISLSIIINNQLTKQPKSNHSVILIIYLWIAIKKIYPIFMLLLIELN
jgi:hypothetical protein